MAFVAPMLVAAGPVAASTTDSGCTVSPERPVLWLLPPDAPSARTRFIQAGCVVFASQGALRAANAAGVAVAANANVAQFIGAEELPTGCALAFGDSLVDQRP